MYAMFSRMIERDTQERLDATSKNLPCDDILNLPRFRP